MANLYETLGVSSQASPSEIAKAYRLKSLECHPDRNPNGTEEFKRLAAAYEVLKDSERRAVYDATGSADGQGGEMMPNLQSEDVEKLLSEFYASYRNSAEEEKEIIESYQAVNGNFVKMITEQLLYQNTDGELNRLLGIVQQLIEKGKLQSTPAWERTSKNETISKLQRRMKREREEAADALEEIQAAKGQKKPSTMDDLRALIVGRHQSNAAAFHSQLDDMERRYAAKSRKSK